MVVNLKKAKCSKCGGVRDGGHTGYCRDCNNEYMRNYRKTAIICVECSTILRRAGVKLPEHLTSRIT